MYNDYMSLDDMLLRREIADAIAAIPINDGNFQLNALGMQMLAIKVALGE